MTENNPLASCKVLVLGAGGLGCEILKNLAMVGIPFIHVVDMDTIELTNLNRQFLYHEQDIGQPKALIAAKYINSLKLPSACPDGSPVEIVPHVCDLTKIPVEFWHQFTAVISGLDAIEPRRYASALLVEITYKSNYEKCIPFIDGGCEGFSGHCKTIIPGINACYECSIGTLPPPDRAYPLCTIANNPRLPEHIVTYVVTVELPDAELIGHLPIDSPKVVAWLLERSKTRAIKFGFNPDAFTERYVLGIAKNIIPSIASTNAIIAATCCDEFLKIVWDLFDNLEEMNNFLVYNGADGCFTYSFVHEKLPNCNICGTNRR